MAKKTAIEIEGIKELDKALKGFLPKFQNKAIRFATRESAKIVAERAKETAPVVGDEGEYIYKDRQPGQLKKNIGVRALPRSRVTSGHAVSIGGKALHVGDQFYAGFIEMGWKHSNRYGPTGVKVEGVGFLRRALYDNRHRVNSTFVFETKRKIDSIAAELRRESGGDKIR